MAVPVFNRFIGFGDAFADPTTVVIVAVVIGGLAAAWIAIGVLSLTGRVPPDLAAELRKRTASWTVMAPLFLGPVLLGASWTIGAVALLGLFCHREFARATGLFRHRTISATVALGVLALAFAALDHWYGFFVALTPLVAILIVTIAVLADQPKGYVQRVALGLFSFLFFGTCLGHLGYMANDVDFRPMILMLLLAVELNDVFAFVSGKLFGHRKLAPNTSPNKTLGGALGALALTTALVTALGHFVFRGSVIDTLPKLVGLGLIVSVAGQLGDLMLSSVKRDLGIKDMGVTIPGHGGFLDRFDSLLLVAPAAFHYIGYFRGIGLESPTRILTGG